VEERESEEAGRGERQRERSIRSAGSRHAQGMPQLRAGI
jgi:hypothetical protein